MNEIIHTGKHTGRTYKWVIDNDYYYIYNIKKRYITNK